LLVAKDPIQLTKFYLDIALFLYTRHDLIINVVHMKVVLK